MFKSIQDYMKINKKPEQGDSLETNYLPVRNAHTIFENDKFQTILQKYPELLSLSTENYQHLCSNLLHRVAEFLQDLPETRAGHHSFRGGALEHVMNRTLIALTQLRTYFLPSGSDTESLTQPQTLWAYAIFTAGLLQGIGKVAVDVRVDLYDRQKKHVKTWSPFDVSMLAQGAYYKYEFDTTFPESFRNRATLLIAKQLMPNKGFQWLASNKELFAIWLSLLDDDIAGGRTLGPILWRADAASISEYFENLLNSKDLSRFLKSEKHQKHLGRNEGQETNLNSQILGNEFLEWLKAKLQAQGLDTEGNLVAAVEGGVVVTNAAFEMFIRENPQYKNSQAVQAAFSGLGLYTLGQSNRIFDEFVDRHSGDKVMGMRIKNPHVILSTKQLQQQATKAPLQATTSKAATQELYIATNGTLTNEVPVPTQEILAKPRIG